MNSSNEFSINQTVDFLKKLNNVNIITHKSPDGDTLGCGFALVNALRILGKNANVLNSDGFPERYDFLYDGYFPLSFDEECVIAVDVADTKLIGSNLAEYMEDGRVDLCIDHHISNTCFAKHTIVSKTAAAAAELLFEIITRLGVMNDLIAKCLYTGIATDTGCFKYQNTTADTHTVAAKLMKYNIDFAKVNRLMFDIKSKGRMYVENQAMKNIKFYFDDKCSLITITTKLIDKTDIEPSEYEGLAGMTLQIEGVQLGILMKQKHENVFKISVRTTDEIDACQFCAKFGGGGHLRAAGCEIVGTEKEVTKMLIDRASEVLG